MERVYIGSQASASSLSVYVIGNGVKFACQPTDRQTDRQTDGELKTGKSKRGSGRWGVRVCVRGAHQTRLGSELKNKKKPNSTEPKETKQNGTKCNGTESSLDFVMRETCQRNAIAYRCQLFKRQSLDRLTNYPLKYNKIKDSRLRPNSTITAKEKGGKGKRKGRREKETWAVDDQKI